MLLEINPPHHKTSRGPGPLTQDPRETKPMRIFEIGHVRDRSGPSKAGHSAGCWLGDREDLLTRPGTQVASFRAAMVKM